MSATTNIQTAATIAAAVASSLANSQVGAALDAGAAAALLGQAIVTAGPLIDPRIGAAVSLATLVLSAVHVAVDSGTGITADQLKALFDADDAAKAADLKAQASIAG